LGCSNVKDTIVDGDSVVLVVLYIINHMM